MQREQLTIGEVANLAGVQTSTLRYYEDIGILPAPQRVNGQRRYSREVLVVLAVIQLAKDANFSLTEIRDLLYSATGHHQNAGSS
jgi:MerR family redox-sensitive transcriptional activator SoxR